MSMVEARHGIALHRINAMILRYWYLLMSSWPRLLELIYWPALQIITWGFLLQRDTGLVNHVLVDELHLTQDRPFWLIGGRAFVSLVVVAVWRTWPFALLCLTAGLQTVPDELYEAAAIDGASYWKIQRWITLPLLGPTIRVWAFLSIIGSLQLFDLVFIIWGQYVAATAGTSTMATYMVREGRLAGNYGYGNAVAVVIFIISLVIALTYQRFVLRRDTEGALTEKPRKKDA